jgi:hypothetical protein
MLLMVKQRKAIIDRKSKDDKKLFIAIGLITAFKLILIPNIQQSFVGMHSGAWLGADGETYLAASEAITKEGLFSKSSLLVYFAPGYSIFLSILHLFTGKLLFLFTSFIQTLLYSYSVLFMGQQLSRTKFNRIVFPFALVLLLNPTLTLSSLVIGYESFVASFFLLAIGLLIIDLHSKESKWPYSSLLISSMLLGLTVWLSPRMILPGLLLLLVWLYVKNRFKKNLLSSLIVLIIFLSFQGSMILRNEIATSNFTSQSSLGTLAIMGAGPNATGTYTDQDTGITCDVEGLDSALSSNKKLKCAYKWYIDNPGQGLWLLWKKSYYLWSPWFGPLYGGTMARNPYLNFHPVKVSITTQSQLDFVMSFPGQLVSWIWILGGWFLLIHGFRASFKLGGFERTIGNISMMIVLSSWLAVLIVPGDNRYRIPFMPFSLFLQICGYKALRKVKLLS